MSFLQICSSEETNSSTFWMAWGGVHFNLGWTAPLIGWIISSKLIRYANLCQSCLHYIVLGFLKSKAKWVRMGSGSDPLKQYRFLDGHWASATQCLSPLPCWSTWGTEENHTTTAPTETPTHSLSSWSPCPDHPAQPHGFTHSLSHCLSLSPTHTFFSFIHSDPVCV